MNVSRKALLIAVALVVLALGVMGAAFATGMDFSNVGALSSGKAELVQINTDDVGFLSSLDGKGVDRVALRFDRDLAAGSTIWVTIEVQGCSGHGFPGADGEVHGWKVLDRFLDEDDEVIVQLDDVIKVDDISKIKEVTVAVAER
jgi:hypothetical protein